MRILTVIAILWAGAITAQTIDGDLYTAELTSIAEKANLPGAYKGKVAIAFANYHNSAIKQYPREVVKINALTNRVADAFSITFTLNGSTMESAQFPVREPEPEPGSASDNMTNEKIALDSAKERQAESETAEALDSVSIHESDTQSARVAEVRRKTIITDEALGYMPRFPGCEHLRGGNQKKYDCAQRELLTFVYDNRQYPEVALQKGIHGTVRVQFTVSETGDIINVEVISSLGYGIDEEALRIVELMNHMEQKWKPGFQSGKPVAVQFTLPIKF